MDIGFLYWFYALTTIKSANRHGIADTSPQREAALAFVEGIIAQQNDPMHEARECKQAKLEKN